MAWMYSQTRLGAAGDAQNSAQAEKQGCLPGAVWSDQSNTFPLPHFKTDPIQCLLSARINVGKIMNAKVHVNSMVSGE